RTRGIDGCGRIPWSCCARVTRELSGSGGLVRCGNVNPRRFLGFAPTRLATAQPPPLFRSEVLALEAELPVRLPEHRRRIDPRIRQAAADRPLYARGVDPPVPAPAEVAGIDQAQRDPFSQRRS